MGLKVYTDSKTTHRSFGNQQVATPQSFGNWQVVTSLSFGNQ